MTPAEFRSAVLDLVPPRLRPAIGDDLTDMFAAGVTPDELGTPAQYAALATGTEPGAGPAGEPQAQPQARVLGVPLDLRGPVDPSVRARQWDPTNPHVLVPHIAGMGWSINFGALAVKAKLLRPDDYDPATLAAIPPGLSRAVRALPAVAAAVTALATALTPARRPTHLVPAMVAIAVAVWGARSTTAEDNLVRPALAAGITSALAGTTIATATGHQRPRSLDFAIATLSQVVPLALMYGQVRVGLRRLWKDRSC